ncbi:MAG: hypothetical protein IKU43_08130 [Clostridia bacterium]|nr:hypothetical protein [Clostridia bacterium]
MKRYDTVRILALLVLPLVTALAVISCIREDNGIIPPDKNYSEETVYENTCPYALFYDGVTYYYTGEVIYDKIDYTEGDEIGKVTSSISEMSMPTEECQANIDIVGSPFIKHELSGDGLLVNIRGEWIIFERRDKKAESDITLEKRYFESPPVLTVSHGDDSITAMRGSYSWIYTDENGEEIGICADGLHPLQAREYMPTLSVKPQIYSHISPKTVYFNFEVAPQEISARAWKSEDFGNIDAESVPVTVNTVEVDLADGGYDTYYELEIFRAEYVYEITASWGDKEKDGFEGTAYYAFCGKYHFPNLKDGTPGVS